ncbi:MAG: tetratricopeptide repeat protein [Euryarchaeota archaeon]|nr:tetratricopeptide repeat protein [Euryarchaeota archaeon]
MIKEALLRYGLSAEQATRIAEVYPDREGILNAEEWELAAIGDLSIGDARRIKEFVRGDGKGTVVHDFLKRWSRVLSEENVEKAYEEYDKLSRLHPDSPVVWQIKGELLEKMGRVEEAKEALARAKQLTENKNIVTPFSEERKIHRAYHTSVRGNGIGLVNGLSMLNGQGNTKDGYKNGLSNGFKNGIINGSGIVNGVGRAPRHGRGGRRKVPNFVRFLVAMALVISLIYAPIFSLTLFEKTTVFRVDGNFEEWNGVMGYYDLRSSPPPLNITTLKFHQVSDGVYFFLETRANMFENASGVYIFIDSDMNSSTGYLVDGIGADYMVEIYGWNASVVGHTFYVFNSTNQNDFKGFISAGTVPVAMSGNKMEGFIPHSFGHFRVVVSTTDYAGHEDVAYVPEVGKHSFFVRVENSTPVVPLNENSPVLEIHIFTFGRVVHIQQISVAFRGTSTPLDMSFIGVYRDNGNGKFDSYDKLITSHWSLGNNETIQFNVSLDVENTTLFLVVNCSHQYLNGKTIFADVADIVANEPYSIEHLIYSGSYIGEVPSSVHIDGAFYDWKVVKKDKLGDVVNPAGVPDNGDPNIDIDKYAAYSGEHMYYYLSVNGHLLGGTDAPTVHHFTLPDSDRDTVPDKFDPYPHDFNNDGIPDNESYVVVDGKKLPDVDGDGIPDYPYGPDMWLNTTIPSWFPKPYAGRHVSVYIGPVPHHSVYGMDTIQIYINSDFNNHTGFSLPQYPLGAEYMVELYGRDGHVYNGSVYKYVNEHWEYLRHVRYYLGYHAIEIDSELNISGGISTIFISDWDSDRDVSDTPMVNPVTTRSVSVEKQLYLHYNQSSGVTYMNTTMGSTAYYGNLISGAEASWTMYPEFAKTFNITGYPVVSLYLVPHTYTFFFYTFIPGMNVSLYSYNASENKTTLIGYDYNPDIENPGWYNFTIQNTTSLSAGESLLLNMKVSGYYRTSIDVYFNGTQYDSRVNLPTDSYVHVDWIRTYNSSGESVLFNRDENATLRTEISDPFGYQDVKNATLSIQYPNGTYFVQNYYLNVTSHTAAANVYTYNFTVPNVPGKYVATVTGVETNGVTDTRQYEFFVRAQRGVVVYPDTTLIAQPGTEAYFNLTALNIGNVADTYSIVPTPPSAHFPFTLYINGSKVAEDSDGDGLWNWVNSSWSINNTVYLTLAPGASASLTVVKDVPNATWGDSDYTILNLSSAENSSIYGTVNITVDVPLLSLSKVLYLNGTSSLYVKHGSSTLSQYISSGNSYTWSFPEVYYSVNITGYILVSLYMSVTIASFSAGAITAALYADSTEIGKSTIDVAQSTTGWFNFTLYPQIDTIPAGSQISLTVSDVGYGTSTTVYYDSSQYPSNVSIPTTDYIKIRSIALYNASGAQTSNFTANSTVRVETVITSPFGVDDISTAYLNITDPTGSVMLSSQPMGLNSASGGEKLFDYTYSIPANGYSGYWHVRVTVHDDPLIWQNATTSFFILWDVNITPNHNISVNVSNVSQVIYFNHTITNTGLGANIFEITARSANGFDIKLYIDGTLAAEDYNGDGVWDYINPSYDTDGDGNPDTGILLPGESENISIAVTVPANFTGNETVTITVYSFLSQSISDSATDKISAVPELNQIIAIPLFIGLIALIKIRRKFTPS